MRVVARLAAVLGLGLAVSGCLVQGHGPDRAGSGASRVLANAEVGSDVGNDRPRSTYDGLMVRRVRVLAFRVGADADLPRLDRRLVVAARRGHLALTTVSPSVLDADDLERLAPNLVVALAPDATSADASYLLGRAEEAARLRGLDVQAREVHSVLVHDLRFTLRTPRPAMVARGIDREGILADALGSYTTRLAHHRLEIAYEGPLLSDRLLQSVRRGIARPARARRAAVDVAPRSVQGVGVDLATEPEPPPASFSVSPHEHDH